MTVFVLLKLSNGRVGVATVFLRPESAEQARKRWLKQQDLNQETGAELQGKQNADIVIMECELKP